MPKDKDPDSKASQREPSERAAGYPAEGKTALDQRAAGAKHNRHVTRTLPGPVALRNEYRKLIKDPKCGRRSAIDVLAKKYKVSQLAVRKALEKKPNQT